jgi:hypothetical protein
MKAQDGTRYSQLRYFANLILRFAKAREGFGLHTQAIRMSSSSESEEEELELDEDGRVACGGRIDYSTRVFDGAVAPTQISKPLLDDCTLAMTARATGDGEALSAGSTFWVPSNANPETALERLALDIFAYHARDAQYEPSTSGAEWWTQVIDPDDDIGLHWDRDYDMEADQGLLLHPHVATVTYLVAPPAAAPTLVLDCVSPLFRSESPCGPISGGIASWPHPGRHLCFDGRLLHGAMSELAEGQGVGDGKSTGKGSPSGGRAGKKPAAPLKRVTFLVNVWLNHKPWGAEELPESVTRKLGRPDKGLKLRLGTRATSCTPATLDARTVAASESRQWTFGEAGQMLKLNLPWPDAPTANLRTATSADGAAPLLALSFDGKTASAGLEPAPNAPRKASKRKRREA